MKIEKEFSRFATKYKKLNVIQIEVEKHLSKFIPSNKSIVDLGCGIGNILNYISYKDYIGLDISNSMLNLHLFKSKKNIKLFQKNFDSKDTFEFLKQFDFDIFISSSALQWSNDLENFFHNIYLFNKNFYFAIFTSNTFKNLHNFFNISSPIYNKEYIKFIVNKLYGDEVYFETKQYKLYFNNNLEILRYIKNTGVSGNRNILKVNDLKNFIENFKYNYLEFEVLYVIKD